MQEGLAEGLKTLQALTWSGAVSQATFQRVRASVTTLRTAALGITALGVLITGLSGFLLPPDVGVPFCVLGSVAFVFLPHIISQHLSKQILAPVLERGMNRSIGAGHSFAIPAFQLQAPET